jgi:hypothetical protein
MQTQLKNLVVLCGLLFALVALSACGADARTAPYGGGEPLPTATPTYAQLQAEVARLQTAANNNSSAKVDITVAGGPENPPRPTAGAVNDPNAPKADDSDDTRMVVDPHGTTVKVAREGEFVPAGTMVVLRYVDHSAMIIDVQGGPLQSDMYAGPDGLVSWDIWYNYRSETHAERDACKQALADLATSDDDNSWNEGYEVTLFGEEIPNNGCREN